MKFKYSSLHVHVFNQLIIDLLMIIIYLIFIFSHQDQSKIIHLENVYLNMILDQNLNLKINQTFFFKLYIFIFCL
jgi:hypothetical protein